MKLRIATLLLALFVGISAVLADNYRVTATKLNVRKSPSVKGALMGALKKNATIEVISVSNNWAKLRYNGKIGYVSAKYITPLPIPEEPEIAEEESEQENVVEDNNYEQVSSSQRDQGVNEVGEYEVETPLVMGSSLSDAMNLYLAVQGGFGWSNFSWSDGSVNGTMAYSANLLAQLYFEDNVSFIPQNWYSEIALGYNKLGAANFDMSYIHLGLCPFGYRIHLDPINIVAKAGVDLAFPLNELETNINSWSTDFQCGVLGGLQIEWAQFAIGCNVMYDFTGLSSSSNQSLNNIGVLGTISYKFGKLGHKK